MKLGDKNVIAHPLVPRDKIIFPPLHIKLGLMKQFDIALNKEGKYFNYLCNTFQGISIEKKEMGIFDGPDIRQLVKICISFNQ